jgi:hypothetical protein
LRNDHWIDAFNEEREVELNNSERFWPGGDLHHFVQRKTAHPAPLP